MMKCSYLRYQWPEIAAARGSDSGRERLNGGGDGDGGDAPRRASKGGGGSSSGCVGSNWGE
jgi:hypothetical protein